MTQFLYRERFAVPFDELVGFSFRSERNRFAFFNRSFSTLARANSFSSSRMRRFASSSLAAAELSVDLVIIRPSRNSFFHLDNIKG